MTDRAALLSAATLGAACGMRTFVAPAALCARGRIEGPARTVLLVAWAGELAADKHPRMTSRLDPRGLGTRVVSAGACGTVLAGPAGGAIGAAVAVAGAHACARARERLSRRTGSDLPWAFLEDALAAGLAAAATRTVAPLPGE